jgi:hypothetical protein
MKEVPMTLISRPRALLACCLTASCLTLATSGAHATTYTATAFNLPGSTYVYPLAINEAGTAVGYYGTKSGNPQGFIYAKGTATSLSYPKAILTYVAGINRAGTIVGTYQDKNGFYHGFIYTAAKGFTDVSVPDATATSLEAINDKGVAVGSSTNASGVTQIITYAKGKFTPITIDTSSTPVPVGIDDEGDIAGWFSNSSGNGENTFVYANGVATILTNPAKVFFSQAYGINKHGVVVGQAATVTGNQYGFAYYSGKYHLDVAACPKGSACYFQGINDAGAIVGANFTGPDLSTGFLLQGKGIYTALPGLNGDTNYAATAINAAGVIVGEASVGAYIWTPKP